MSEAPGAKRHPDFSEEFYRGHAQRYAEVSHQLIQSVYKRSSHPALKGDLDLLETAQGAGAWATISMALTPSRRTFGW